MKKAMALAALTLLGSNSWAQSNVTLYGLMDLALRHTTNEGPAGDSGKSNTGMVGGGMGQSRWGLRGTEDLGGGNKVSFGFEQRVAAQTGAVVGSPSVGFQQSWVAIESPTWGRVALGRQFHSLFDLYTTTFASYPYAPYFDMFKPEVGMSLGARFNELIKYTGNFGKFRLQLDATLTGEGTATLAGTPGTFNSGGKGRSAFLRWADGGWTVGAGYQQRGFGGAGRKMKAWVAGASYRTGPWYFTGHYSVNKHNLPPQASCGSDAQCTLDYRSLSGLWSATANGGFSGPAFTAANKRQMLSLGVGYQISPALNLGAHYWFAKQGGHSADAKARVHMVSVVANYGLSKRTSVYAEVDHMTLKGDRVSLNGIAGTSNGAKNRTGITLGLRHNF